MTVPGDDPLRTAMRAGDIAALDRIAAERPGTAEKADRFRDAVALCAVATVRWFLDRGADPDLSAQDGFPALHLAIDRTGADRVEVVALLLGRGADPALRTRIDDHATAEKEARLPGRTEAADFPRNARAVQR